MKYSQLKKRAMNKHKLKSKVEELEFELQEMTKDRDHWKGEHGRLRTAYKMSEKEIRELKGYIKEDDDNKVCPNKNKCNVIMFTSDLDICTKCNKQFDGK